MKTIVISFNRLLEQYVLTIKSRYFVWSQYKRLVVKLSNFIRKKDKTKPIEELILGFIIG
jgi:hypothetical protein